MEERETNPFDDLLEKLCARLQGESDCTRAGVMHLFDRMGEVAHEPYPSCGSDQSWKGENNDSSMNMLEGIRHTIMEWPIKDLRGYYREVNEAV